MITLLKTIILPKLDFGSILWAPYEVQDMRKIEKIQSNFTKWIKIPGIDQMDYWQRLNALKLYPIERRFKRYTIIYVWKILHNQIPNLGISFKRYTEEEVIVKFNKSFHT